MHVVDGASAVHRSLSVGLLLLAAISAPTVLVAQQRPNSFLDDTTVQVINLTMDPADWATLQQNYLTDTYYHAAFTWNGITENIGIRSHGGGSRSPLKPNFDLNFAKYDKTQTFLGIPFVLLKANNEDPSNLREWISMKLFRRMGLPAPREAPAQVYLNGNLLGFYFIVEHEDTTFVQRDFGENTGYLYEFEDNGTYEFESLGADPSAYASLLNLKSNQSAPDLQTFANLVQIINQASSAAFTDDQFVTALSAYLDPNLFLTHIAIESALAESDGICGGVVGMNNFYLYQFQNQTLYQMIAWDKDNTFSDPNRDIFYGITTGTNINRLAQRLIGIPRYKAVFLNALAEAESLLGGAGGWADQQVTNEYNIIHAAAIDDPNKQCPSSSGLAACGVQDFETNVDWLHTFLALRSPVVTTALAAAGYTGSTSMELAGVSALGGTTAVSPGAVATVAGTSFGEALQASAEPLPRILGQTFVAVDGVRAPLFSVAPGAVEFQVPGDLDVGTASVVVFNGAALSKPLDVSVLASTPSIIAVTHADGSPVTTQNPLAAGEAFSIFATGLGAVSGDPGVGIVGPSKPPVTTSVLPELLCGGTPLNVTFSGLAPGYVGLYQINAVFPADAPTLTLNLSMAGQSVTWSPGQ